MKTLKNKQDGFGAVELILILIIVALLGVVGWFVYDRSQNKTSDSKASTTTTSAQPTSTKKATQQPTTTTDSYTGWKTFSDSSGSNFSLKYPSDWSVDTNSKAYAWTITSKTNSNASVGARWSSLSGSTPKAEWDNCPSLDACGHPASDKTLESKTQTINGFTVYAAKMQGSDGTYHVAVFKDKADSDGTSTFVELIAYSDDSSTVNIFNQIVNSAKFTK